jgi:hypothetical protein
VRSVTPDLSGELRDIPLLASPNHAYCKKFHMVFLLFGFSNSSRNLSSWANLGGNVGRPFFGAFPLLVWQNKTTRSDKV